MSDRIHLHSDDCPQALAVLAEVIGGRTPAGYELTDSGAWVEWVVLSEISFLSSTEKAAVMVARGIAAAERQGGWPPRVRDALVAAVNAL